MDLQAKIKKIEALIAGGKSEGERNAPPNLLKL